MFVCVKSGFGKKKGLVIVVFVGPPQDRIAVDRMPKHLLGSEDPRGIELEVALIGLDGCRCHGGGGCIDVWVRELVVVAV